MKTINDLISIRVYQYLFMIAIIVFFSSAIVSASGEPQSVKIDLDTAVKIAIEKNPMIAASRGEAAAATARGQMASSQRRPSLSTTSFLTNSDMSGIISGPSTVMPTAFSSYPPTRAYAQNLMLMVPLDVSGKISRSIKSASIRANASNYDVERTRQDVVLAVRAAFYETLYQEQNIAVFESAVKVAFEQLKNDEAMVNAGKAPAYYLERDRAELAMNEQSLLEVRRDASTARIRLAMLMGIDPSTPLELSGSLDAPSSSSIPGELPVDNPDVISARLRVDAAKASLESAKRASKPDIGITFMADRISARDSETMNGTTAALVVAFPLWDGGMRKAIKKENSAMQEAASQELRTTQLNLKSDFLSAKLEFETSLQNIATAESALKSSEENYRIAKIRYEAGKSILIEMLDALSSVTRAKVNRIRVIRDSLVARDMLLRLAGQL